MFEKIDTYYVFDAESEHRVRDDGPNYTRPRNKRSVWNGMVNEITTQTEATNNTAISTITQTCPLNSSSWATTSYKSKIRGHQGETITVN